MKVDDRRGVAQVEVAELDAEALDDGVGEVLLLSLDDSDFLFEVLDASIDLIDVDFAHVCWCLVVGYPLCYQGRDGYQSSFCRLMQTIFYVF